MGKRPTQGQGGNRDSDDGSNFDSPGAAGFGDGEAASGGGEGIVEAYEPPSGEQLGAEALDLEADAVIEEVGEDIRALKAEIEDRIAGTAGSLTEAASVQSIGHSNVVGIGFGSGDALASASAMSANVEPGQAALVVFTVEAVPSEQVMAEVASAAGTRALSTVPVLQVPVGIVDAYAHRMRLRPAPGGISVGHFAITAGTIGCLSTGLRAPRTSRLMILSNNHVIANSNAARIGDCICQPGPFDGGRCPTDQVAVLERFVPITFGGAINYVDAATGWAWPDRVRRELLYLVNGQPAFFRVGSVPIAPAPGMVVGKSGRTTQLRQGRISAVNVSVNVNYGGGRIAHFRDQISITGIGGDFSAGGDSGSLIWQWSPARPPVGLLFAGGGGTTFGNRITRVLQSLDIRLVT